ncbi:VOC family protein [Actomonas aquatica]|uniref:VOC family protein n=1 Tax=Actomonas aquatica TaxID=2866162 RepID=A0ABZ1C7M2_9BACT|nr:VOC family protein [Opitutus sp. WL0086]WRQ87438.1 VOC family protein [Opitutus sp. WL0086]
MQLGAFSVSLAVKDIAASLAFYEKLGFAQVGGELEQNWLILRNGDTTLGLFQGMFEKNCLTFNPGWDSKCEALAQFDDVRAIQKHLQDAGVELIETADADGSGPAHITLVDPDGNPVLIDQHVG